jgi:lipoyl(octanoyl) transferase
MLVTILGLTEYAQTYERMQAFTAARAPESDADAPDELWICQHPPTYTQGLAGRAEHIFGTADIPIVQTNRGGQVTYHGPGQVVAYPLVNLRRAGYFVKEYVFRIEEAVIRTLRHFGVTGHRVIGAPGIYVILQDPFGHSAPRMNEKGPLNFSGLGKIAALGIKVSRHCTYHGVALNVSMDLEPYSRINPCGYAGLQTVDLSTIGVPVQWDDVAAVFSQKLVSQLVP